MTACYSCNRMPVSGARMCWFCGAETVVVKADRLIRAVYTWCAMQAAGYARFSDALKMANTYAARRSPAGARAAAAHFMLGFAQAEAFRAREFNEKWPQEG